MKFTLSCLLTITAVVAAPAAAADHAGQAVYDNTCKNCHEGAANLTASDFYKVKIPLITSDTIQNKSDAELKAVITGGRGNMPQVRVQNRPVTPHTAGQGEKLTEQQVNDVIAYIRTKKS